MECASPIFPDLTGTAICQGVKQFICKGRTFSFLSQVVVWTKNRKSKIRVGDMVLNKCMFFIQYNMKRSGGILWLKICNQWKG